MPNSIPNVTVEAPVIQLNNHYFLENGQYAPQTISVPCGVNALVDYFNWWMTPVNDYGIVTILQAIPAEGENVSKPTPESISVIRIRDKYRPHWTWWVVSSLEDYYAACAACCGDAPAPIPEPDLPVIVPCQKVCDSTNEAGEYIAVFGMPKPDDAEFFGNGYLNGEALPDVTGATATALLADINSKWHSIGSPSKIIIWTKSADDLTLIGTGFSESDVICVLITNGATSP